MKRILFVDDEPQMLDGLRALLRPQRKRWAMVFVASGEAALAELGRAPFDVIVSDMKMPGMDGATLLERVQERFPGVLRIALSGYAEMETALRTVPVAHQFLMKPCDAQVLESTLDRICNLQSLIHDDAVRAYVSKIQKLPLLPSAFFELTQVLADGTAGVEAVARVVERDAAMCAKVLQLVNSAFVGVGREIVDIEQAVAYLGINMLKELTLIVQVFDPGKANRSVVQTLDELRHHSLLVGRIARQMAGNDRRLAEDAFMAGILHDVGKLILASEHTGVFERITARAHTEQRAMFEVEQEELGVTHAELGGYLLGIWGLPYPIVEATANHHAPERVAQRHGLDTLATTYIANLLTHEQALQRNPAESFAPMDEAYLDALGVRDQLPAWREIAEELGAAAEGNSEQQAA